ncbi:MAG TPA: hypothetical protein VGK45_11665 [Thermoanaerobaculia bacterium]
MHDTVPPPEAHDPQLQAALKQVLQVIYKEHPLQANQILVLAAELQRLGVHRLVEEHISKFQSQLDRGSRQPVA